MVQAVILLSGALAIWLTQVGSLKASRVACLIGLAGQPFWLYATCNAGQWGMFLLSVFYTGAWLMGVRTYWLKRGVRGE
jgi:hypothetical protein